MEHLLHQAIAVALPQSVGGRLRHRIREIKIEPTPSKRPVELELLVNDEKLHTFPSIQPGDPLHWDLQLLPYDVSESSRITIRVTEKRFLHPNRVLSTTYVVGAATGYTSVTLNLRADSPQQSRAIYSLSARSRVIIEFPDPGEIQLAYSMAIMRARARVGKARGPLEHLGNAQQVFGAILGLGTILADLNPAVKLVVTLFEKMWQYLGELQQNHDDIKTLVHGLNTLLPFVDWAKEHVKEGALNETTPKMLNLIEDSSNFVVIYLSDNPTARIIRGIIDKSAPDRLNDLMRRLAEFKEEFDRGIQEEAFKETLRAKQRALLERLSPAGNSHYNHTQPHLEVAQQKLVQDVQSWAREQDQGQNLLWVHGPVSQDNSSISASICRALDADKILGAHFFCKHDVPELQCPENILNTLVYRLATKYEPYGKMVATAIEDNLELPRSSLEERYIQLLEKPLSTLEREHRQPTTKLFFVVDSLEGCEQGRTQQLLLTYLQLIPLLAPWIGVIITSHPELDIASSSTINVMMYESV